MSKNPLLVVTGPTASGKTVVGIDVARVFDGEIVNADSRQVYRGMDVGTAKPTAVEQAEAKHHLLDIVEPDEDFSLGLYIKLAHAAIAEIHARGKLPLLVGGTGLYARAVSQGFDVPEVAPNRDLRRRLENEAAEDGPVALLERLKTVDPVSAARIDRHNVRRIIRAIEVTEALGEPFSARRRSAAQYDSLTIVLVADKPLLFERADERLTAMMRNGFLSEVARLLNAGYSLELPSMSAVGYRELARHLRAECVLKEALEATRSSTRAFIKRQLTWFRADAGVRRVDISHGDVNETARRLVGRWLASTAGGRS